MLFGISAKITIRQDTRVGCRQGHFMEFRVIQIFNSDLVGLHILILCYGYSALLLFHSGQFLFMKTTDYGHTMAKSQIGIWILRLSFLQKYWLINGKHGQGIHSTKIIADKSAKNTPNAHSLSAQIVCPIPKFWNFDEKRLYLESVVHGWSQQVLP